MDPMNNPTPTPNPAPTPAPGPAPMPAPTSAQAVEDEVTASMASGMPAPGPAPAPNPTPSPMPNPMAAPVNPVVQPSGMPAQPPVNPVVVPNGIGATDPIMMPEKPQEPDPIEEELKAPMKAAAPVPGSIGSAVNGPGSGVGEMKSATGADVVPGVESPFAAGVSKPTPSVSFNDPAAQPDANNPAQAQQPVKKKANKMTLIALIVVAAVIVVALVGILISQMTGTTSGSANKNSSSVAYVEEDTEEEEVIDEETEEIVAEPTDSVVCVASAAGESGTTQTKQVIFTTDNGMMTGVNVETVSMGADGNATAKDGQETTLSAVLVNGIDEKYVTANGKILVTLDTLSTQLETALNANNDGYTYECQVS